MDGWRWPRGPWWLAIPVVAIAARAEAGIGQWTTGGPYGGPGVGAIAVDPETSSTVYAVSGGLLRSTDSGTTWNLTSSWEHDPIRVFAIDPSAPSTLYAGTCAGFRATRGGVFKSTDSGGHWAASGLESDCVLSLAIDPVSPSNLYVGTDYWGIFRSTDSGGTWTGNGALRDIRTLVVDPITPSVVFAVASGGVLKSTDAGLAWIPSGAGLSTAYVSALVIDPANPSILFAAAGASIFRSTDAGGSWTSVAANLTSSQVSALVLGPGAIYAASFGDGLFRSTNAGATWVRVDEGVTDLAVSSLAASPGPPSTLYAGTNSGVFRSTDDGSVWEMATTGLPILDVRAIAVDRTSPSTVYATSDLHGVFRSVDRGSTWRPVDRGLPDLRAESLAIDPLTPSTLYVGMWLHGVFKSTDSGGSWTATGEGASEVLGVAPGSPTTVYASSGQALVTSTDAGDSWHAAGGGLPDRGILALAIDPMTPSNLYVGMDEAGVFRSTDSGSTWSAANTGFTNPNIFSLAVDPVDPSTLYAGDLFHGAFRSTDAGGTWTAVNNGLDDWSIVALVVDPALHTTVYAGTYSSGIFRSLDSGGTWAPLNVGLPATAHIDTNTLSIDPTDPPVLYVGLGEASVWQLTLASSVTVPIVLSAPGLNGSFFTSELTLTNPGTSDDVVRYTYTAAFGGSSGTASDTLPAGTQKTVSDAIDYLKGLGVPVGESGTRGGTLRIEFPGAGAATVRTTTAVPDGRAGLAYAGIPSARLHSRVVTICGLRQNTMDRSNVAVVNAGLPASGPITLRLTVISGDPARAQSKVLPEITLAPRGFRQVDGVLVSEGLSLTNGFVKVERVAGTAPFAAYGVINVQSTSDGSFVEAVPEAWRTSTPFWLQRMTLPALVETKAYSSELVITNLYGSPRTIHAVWVASALSGGRVAFDILLLPFEQQILPAFVQVLRSRGVVTDPPGPDFVGSLFLSSDYFDPASLEGLSVGARISTGGRYGVFQSAVPAVPGAEATSTAWLYDLRQDADNRTNLALVNVGSADDSPSTFRIDLFDGATGRQAATIDDLSLPAKGFRQLNAILQTYAPTTTSGYALVTKTSGSNPFLAYAVINDGGRPGERSGDGAIIPADVPGAPSE